MNSEMNITSVSSSYCNVGYFCTGQLSLKIAPYLYSRVIWMYKSAHGRTEGEWNGMWLNIERGIKIPPPHAQDRPYHACKYFSLIGDCFGFHRLLQHFIQLSIVLMLSFFYNLLSLSWLTLSYSPTLEFTGFFIKVSRRMPGFLNSWAINKINLEKLV